MKLKVVCAGAGWVTRSRHLPALLADPRLEVLGIVDPQPARAAAVADAFHLPHSGASLTERWAGQADCLTVGTPPATHADLIAAALERGWHCLCEKPLAMPATRAGELVEQAAEAKLVLAVFHNFQFSRSGQKLFDLVESGGLGRVEAVYAFQLSNPKRRLPEWYRSLPGGLFFDEAPHLLYLLRRILGRLEPRSVDARLDGNEIRDISATFEHETIWASLSMSFGASVSEWQFVVVGTGAVAVLDIFRDILVVLPNDGGHRAREILRASAHAVGGHLAGVVSSGARLMTRKLSYGANEVVARFVDAIEGRPARITWMTGEDGSAVVTAMSQLLERVGIAE